MSVTKRTRIRIATGVYCDGWGIATTVKVGGIRRRPTREAASKKLNVRRKEFME